ncbi:PAAR domain-containing protein [Aidingimonas halophila]|uniref:Zn-binding Pro-Ala-Ala-Arg (PAAR) domain-containing protein, incolved in TypeVI secretion n=1 Tax=Aidingimonas halophila TaxID=574349 RepID=A0A1H3FK20_9GAMM|nr:PAAR domain-containing protein [Aidingimonas halophila]GHC37663.1 hypothetical protein GCM10008094_33670 [Aidingimonas halophila]SDX91402.1 Zn-binding Pro-Ala-Ala-Arg (PAAR) domain-containing protein, incolved in TypeVI secretion [Aidingimonas halophila]
MDQAKLGDRVNCSCTGGPHRIVTGASSVFVDGVPAARVGDKSSCGATITTGLDWYSVEGAPAAMRGSATSCGGVVEASSSVKTGSPSQVGRFDLGGQGAAASTGATPSEQASSGKHETAPRNPDSASESNGPRDDADDHEVSRDKEGVDPGFVIVRKLTSRAELKRDLLPAATPDVDAMFERLNGHLGDVVLPGSMVVLSDPDNQQCQADEARLMDEARKVQDTVQRLEPPQAQAMVDHWGAFEDIALTRESESTSSDASLSSASTAVGLISSAGQNLFNRVRSELDDLADLYQRTLDPAVRQSREEFHSLRQAAFQRIDAAVPSWLRRPLNLPATGEALKQKIGVEARQTVHHLRTATEGFQKFEIPTVSEAVVRVGLASKLSSIGSAVGVGLDIKATQETIANACTQDREQECQRIQYIEYGKLAGRVAGGALGSGVAVSRGVCFIVSFDFRGRLTCGVAVAGAGSYGGAKALELIGGEVGNYIYEVAYHE